MTGDSLSPVIMNIDAARFFIYSFASVFASNFPRSVLRNGEVLPRSLILRARAAYV